MRNSTKIIEKNIHLNINSHFMKFNIKSLSTASDRAAKSQFSQSHKMLDIPKISEYNHFLMTHVCTSRSLHINVLKIVQNTVCHKVA